MKDEDIAAELDRRDFERQTQRLAYLLGEEIEEGREKPWDVFRRWIDDGPEWKIPKSDRHRRTFRTGIVVSAFHDFPEAIEDEEGGAWKLLESWTEDQERECPKRQDEEPAEEALRLAGCADPCPWCEDVEEHGYVYEGHVSFALYVYREAPEEPAPEEETDDGEDEAAQE